MCVVDRADEDVVDAVSINVSWASDGPAEGITGSFEHDAVGGREGVQEDIGKCGLFAVDDPYSTGAPPFGTTIWRDGIRGRQSNIVNVITIYCSKNWWDRISESRVMW